MYVYTSVLLCTFVKSYNYMLVYFFYSYKNPDVSKALLKNHALYIWNKANQPAKFRASAQKNVRTMNALKIAYILKTFPNLAPDAPAVPPPPDIPNQVAPPPPVPPAVPPPPDIPNQVAPLPPPVPPGSKDSVKADIIEINRPLKRPNIIYIDCDSDSEMETLDFVHTSSAKQPIKNETVDQQAPSNSTSIAHVGAIQPDVDAYRETFSSSTPGVSQRDVHVHVHIKQEEKVDNKETIFSTNSDFFRPISGVIKHRLNAGTIKKEPTVVDEYTETYSSCTPDVSQPDVHVRIKQEEKVDNKETSTTTVGTSGPMSTTATTIVGVSAPLATTISGKVTGSPAIATTATPTLTNNSSVVTPPYQLTNKLPGIASWVPMVTRYKPRLERLTTPRIPAHLLQPPPWVPRLSHLTRTCTRTCTSPDVAK